MSSFVRGPIAVTGIIWRCYFRLRSCFFSAKIRIRRGWRNSTERLEPQVGSLEEAFGDVRGRLHWLAIRLRTTEAVNAAVPR